TKMNLKSSAVSAVFRAVAVVSIIGASTFAASMAVAALTPTQQAAADTLAQTLATAIANASTGTGNQQADVEAAIAAALVGQDPIIANAALAAAAKSSTVTAVLTIPGVQDAIFAQKTTVLAAAIVEAANNAGSDPAAIQAAVSDVVATASVSPTIAAAAFQLAQSSGDLNSSTTTTVANLGDAVQTLVDNNQTGTIQVATTQPNATEPTAPFYVG
ncbi:MAG: hypothetical protein Q7T21_13295, partial [Gallionella sp.]|nr:hypothetical protein [Gallionella sp.]